MNILFYNHSGFNPKKGGTERVVDTLSENFSKDGHSIYYATIHNETKYKSPYPYLVLDEYKFSSLNSIRIRLLSDFIIRNKIDIIVDNFHHNKLKYLKMIAAVKKKTGVKVVALYHTSPKGHECLWSRMGDNSSLGISEKKRFKEFLMTKAQIARRERTKTKKALRYRLNHYDKIILLSERFFPEAIDLTGEKNANKYAAIPNPVGSLANLPRKQDKCNELLWVGRMAGLKRPEKALQIWTSLQDQFPQWCVNFLGEGELYEAMKKLSDSIAQRCHFLGHQNPEPYYQKAKILLLTSDFEGLPLVLIEAQRHGVIPIAFDNFASLQDIIQNGVTGITIPTNDMVRYSQELSNLMKDEKRLATMSENARQHSQKFAIENVLPMWYELFSSLGLSTNSNNDYHHEHR